MRIMAGSALHLGNPSRFIQTNLAVIDDTISIAIKKERCTANAIGSFEVQPSTKYGRIGNTHGVIIS